ncbi:hypothetical protein [Agromyces larvae]|uniref:Phage holin family protein n=1 Tax=Agromyces larvae TaxID=2929802 RepID=A0ABY4BUT0_9MICO|nr:hypothetical protein [Agromyces larvae]UOE42966.1 hypothetical protein MTO99_12290 [Agromyces larvae]
MTEPARARGAAFWICYAITAVSAIVSVSFAVIAVVDGGVAADNANALYAAARSIALVLVVLIAPIFRVDSALLVGAVAMTIVQGIDTFIGAVQGDLAKTVGPAVLCLATLIAATVLARSDRMRDRD